MVNQEETARPKRVTRPVPAYCGLGAADAGFGVRVSSSLQPR